MIDRVLAEDAAGRKSGVARTDDNRRKAFDGTASPRAKKFALEDLDGNVGRICDDVEHRRALLRLRDQRLDLLLRSIGIDLEADLDVVVAVAHLAVNAEDAIEIH